LIAEHWLEDNRPTVLISEESLDTNPGWASDGEWAFGQPTGNGGLNGNPDPGSGYTNTNVYGVNLSGDYSTSTGGPYYLTTGPFDCSGCSMVSLKFARWLNTDEPAYVESKIEVSNNGSDWLTIWEHTGTEPIEDNDWQLKEYDIGDVADNQPTVYIRWSYEIVSDEAYPFSGWNIDDVQLWGNE